MYSKVKSVTMEIPEDLVELQKIYARTIVKILVKKLSSKQLDELIEKVFDRNINFHH
ncbi:hypothetical protein [Clostridium akagii]|uniref:hypothetical protein n=1 Tax=Clostridium akagii TaxID=91623 RepID=UPI000A769E2B|nr:hypothetical protein [Clostridium akagii]